MENDKSGDLTKGGKLPWFRRERRTELTYRERLSNRFVNVAAIGALFVILDPQLTIHFTDGTTLKLGGEGFSLDLKGLVIGAILIEGYKAIKEYWFGSTAAGQKTTEVVERMAESAAPAAKIATEAALAVAAALPSSPKADVVEVANVAASAKPDMTIKSDTMAVDGKGATINIIADADKKPEVPQPPKGTT